MTALTKYFASDNPHGMPPEAQKLWSELKKLLVRIEKNKDIASQESWMTQSLKSHWS